MSNGYQWDQMEGMDELHEFINDLEPGTRLTVYGLPEEIYHAAPGLGSTAFKEAQKSMAHYKVYRDEEREPKKAFEIGSAVHTLTLEPELWEERYIKQPAEFKTKASKAYKEWAAQHESKTVLTADEISEVEGMTDALLNNAGQFLIGGHAEVSFWYKDKSGLVLKSRVDYLLGDGAIDLKTRRKPMGSEPHDFTRFVKYEYDLQDALYRRVSGVTDMFYIGVGKYKPYPVFLRKQGEDVRERAEKKLDKLIGQIKTAEEFDEYPAYPLELIETGLTDREKEMEV